MASSNSPKNIALFAVEYDLYSQFIIGWVGSMSDRLQPSAQQHLANRALLETIKLRKSRGLE